MAESGSIENCARIAMHGGHSASVTMLGNCKWHIGYKLMMNIHKVMRDSAAVLQTVF